jgi:hypothetical protein
MQLSKRILSKEKLARDRCVHGWAFRKLSKAEADAYRAFVRGYGPCPPDALTSYRIARAQLGLTSDWYEAFADAVHAMGKQWPEALTEEEEAVALVHADNVADRPEEERDDSPVSG